MKPRASDATGRAPVSNVEETGWHLAIGNVVLFAIVCAIVWTFDAQSAAMLIG